MFLNENRRRLFRLSEIYSRRDQRPKLHALIIETLTLVMNLSTSLGVRSSMTRSSFLVLSSEMMESYLCLSAQHCTRRTFPGGLKAYFITSRSLTNTVITSSKKILDDSLFVFVLGALEASYWIMSHHFKHARKCRNIYLPAEYMERLCYSIRWCQNKAELSINWVEKILLASNKTFAFVPLNAPNNNNVWWSFFFNLRYARRFICLWQWKPVYVLYQFK